MIPATVTEPELTPGQKARAERDARLACEKRARESADGMRPTWALIQAGLADYARTLRFVK